MSKWDPEKYLVFQRQRTQPAIDLAKRVADRKPDTIADIGCGPGNSTVVLKAVFPDASSVLGIDNSAEMIERHGKTIKGLTLPLLPRQSFPAAMIYYSQTPACNGFLTMSS